LAFTDRRRERAVCRHDDETSSRTMNVFFIFIDTRRARYWTKLVI